MFPFLPTGVCLQTLLRAQSEAVQHWRLGNGHKQSVWCLRWEFQSLGSRNCICFASTSRSGAGIRFCLTDRLFVTRETESFRPHGFMPIYSELEWVLNSGLVYNDRCHRMFNQVFLRNLSQFWQFTDAWSYNTFLPQLQHRSWLWKYHDLTRIYLSALDLSFLGPNLDMNPTWRFSPNTTCS